MTPRPKVYLAGPEVFLSDAADQGRLKKALCADFGFEGLFPLDCDGSASAGLAPDRAIYDALLVMMRAADFGIFNLTPFRGPSADVGTVFELGLMTGLGKPCFGYTNVADDLLDRVRAAEPLRWDDQGATWRDAAARSVEDFGNGDNLMIDKALEAWGTPMVRRAAADPLRDLTALTECLQALRACVTRPSARFGE